MGLTVKGAAASASQQGYAQKILTVGKGLGAGTVPLTASIYAGIYESGLGVDNTVNSSGYGGVLAGNTSTIIGDPSSDATTNNQATLFFKGGNGYNAGGAIALSGSTSNPIEIAIRVEVPSIWPDNAYAHEGGYPGDSAAVAEAAAFVAAFGGGTLSGGTAGLGGTGTTPGSTQPQSSFQIGDTSNPDEDYWTALNRLGQDAYWYVFSDGIWLYIADGYQIMKQPPVRTLNRFDPAVLRLEGEWDNSAWQFAATHKRRGRIQRKSTLAKIASPTQINCDLICKIDDVRAGQVVQVLGTGAMDGPWLIGDCRRPVFQTYSSLTLVPALTPISAAQTSTSAASTSGTSAPGAAGAVGGVVNPVPGASISRLDMGIDGSGGQIVAPYNGTVTNSPRGWPNGGGYFYIVNDSQGGPDYTRAMYFAENMQPTVSGHVNQGQVIGSTGSGSWEFGPAAASISYDPLAKVYGLGSDGARQMVLAFYGWLRAAGLPATDNPSNAGNA